MLKGNLPETDQNGKRSFKGTVEEVYTDMDETKEEQENRIEYFWKKGNQQFTEDGRNAEITVDQVLQGAKLSENKVNGPEDAIVSEMIKKFAHGEDLHYHEVLPQTLHGHDRVSKLVESGEFGVLEEAGCSLDERDQKLQSNSSDVGDVEVVCILYYFFRGEDAMLVKEKGETAPLMNAGDDWYLNVLVTNRNEFLRIDVWTP